MMHVVWFKRCLRLLDHAPLHHAVQAARQATDASKDSVLLLVLLEPELINQPDCAPQHIEFAKECWQSLAQDIADLHQSHEHQLQNERNTFVMCLADAPLLFDGWAKQGLKWTLYSHEETGNWASFMRDKAVAKVCRKHNVLWRQWPSNGVVRALKHRDDWAKHWMERTSQDILPIPPLEKLDMPTAMLEAVFAANRALNVPTACVPNQPSTPWPAWTHIANLPFKPSLYGLLQDKPLRQKGGRMPALKCMEDFFQTRGQMYRYEMSSPITAGSSCSRLSPYLAYGVLSIRMVWQRLCAQRDASASSALPLQAQKLWRASLKSFESRLHWHCHFIQKLESEPELEWRAAHIGMDGLRNAGELTDEERCRLQAWITGQTGFPMIDACMRLLIQTGWINFRMRAMLVAFASYQLWLDWRHTAPLLAREFLDYEPGIHYPQFQMQSGVTGINTLRIYCPVKQAQDQDPDGTFLAQWLPELAHLPAAERAAPWRMPPMLQMMLALDAKGQANPAYPASIVNPDTAMKEAKEKFSAYQANLPDFENVAKRVYEKHGSRNRRR